MKKGLIYVLLWLIFFLPVSAFADEVDHPIDDQTSIEEDFQVLNQDINDYYVPSYELDKWYVVAMAETSISESKIQTYFYLYNPTLMRYLPKFDLQYQIGENEFLIQTFETLSYHADHRLCKVKGFQYDFVEETTLSIKKIRGYWEEDDLYYSTESLSGFTADVTHIQNNNLWNITLKYDSTLIIDDFIAVDVEIKRDHSFWAGWYEFWQDFFLPNQYLYLEFYNFNFPDSIQPDKIDYAKFSYDYWDIEYMEMMYRDGSVHTVTTSEQVEKITSEYEPGTHTFKANGGSKELTFETFYLGNRIEDGEFEYLEFAEADKPKFNYDCSILLGSYINTDSDWTYNQTTLTAVRTGRKTVIENIDFLELWYTKDDVQYRCQIVSKPIDPDIIHPSVKKNGGKKYLISLN